MKVVFGTAMHREVPAGAEVVDGLEEVEEVWIVRDAEAYIATLRKMAEKPLHVAMATRLATQVSWLCKALERRHTQLTIHMIKQESHRYCLGNHVVDAMA